MNRTVLYERQAATGANFSSYHGWEVAEDYGASEREYQAVREQAGVLDVSYAGKIRVTGADRIRYLHNLLSNDIRSLVPGRGCYATLLTHQGHIESDLYAYVGGEEVLLECPPSGTSKLFESLSRFIIADKVALENATAALGILSFQGPEAPSVITQILGEPVKPMEMLEHRAVNRKPSWRVVRRDRSGSDGFDLWVPATDMPSLWDRALSMGSVLPVGHRALNWLRTEAGIPWHGSEIRDKSLPMELGMDSAISLSKGCYRGQEIVARVIHRGQLQRGLAALAVGHDTEPEPGSEVHAGGTKVGEVASATWSPRLGKPLALALMKNEFRSPGVRVEIVSGSSVLPAEIVALPVGRNTGAIF